MNDDLLRHIADTNQYVFVVFKDGFRTAGKLEEEGHLNCWSLKDPEVSDDRRIRYFINEAVLRVEMQY